jgi:hypothetical protein
LFRNWSKNLANIKFIITSYIHMVQNCGILFLIFYKHLNVFDICIHINFNFLFKRNYWNTLTKLFFLFIVLSFCFIKISLIMIWGSFYILWLNLIRTLELSILVFLLVTLSCLYIVFVNIETLNIVLIVLQLRRVVRSLKEFSLIKLSLLVFLTHV